MRLLSRGYRVAVERCDATATAILLVTAIVAYAGIAAAVHHGAGALRPVLAIVALGLAFSRLTRGAVAAFCLVGAGWLLHG